MLNITLTLQSEDVLARLVRLHPEVAQATRDELLFTAKGMVANMHDITQNKEHWFPPHTTGNLDMSIGFLTAQGQGSGMAGLRNYQNIRHVTARRFSTTGGFVNTTSFKPGTVRGKVDVVYPMPTPPTNPNSIVVFALATYASFLEYGTVHAGARPFFNESVDKYWKNIDDRLAARVYKIIQEKKAAAGSVVIGS